MEYGTEQSKTVDTFILQKILTDDTGLQYICQTYERFSHVAKVLGLMVLNLAKVCNFLFKNTEAERVDVINIYL